MISRRGLLQSAANGPFEPTWESIGTHYQTPRWFSECKFGIFMHWGLYAVPAHHNEWYARHMYSDAAISKWHAEHYGPQDRFGYKDFIPLFKAEKYDPDAWAAFFKKPGARYVMPAEEDHDGFAMYDSALTEWCAAKMGPKRDPIGDSNHRFEHWDFMYPRFKWPGEQLTIAAAAKRKVRAVSMLGLKGALEFSQDDAGLKIELPEKTGDHAFAFKLV
jgi:alpha-L-fucosidase